jgi:hypothetical protein
MVVTHLSSKASQSPYWKGPLKPTATVPKDMNALVYGPPEQCRKTQKQIGCANCSTDPKKGRKVNSGCAWAKPRASNVKGAAQSSASSLGAERQPQWACLQLIWMHAAKATVA